MEYVLLGDARIASERSVVKLSVKIRVNSTLHPHVDRKRVKVRKSKQRNAGSHLVSYALYFLKALNGIIVGTGSGDFFKIYLTRGYLIRCIAEVFVSEAGI